jgi:hypothetical protein
MEEVQVWLDRSLVEVKMTQPDGVANFRLKIKKPRGLYNMTFQVLAQPDVPPAYILVNVTGCGLGEVLASSADACITCVEASYSFNPQNTTCDACPINAGEPCTSEAAWHCGFGYNPSLRESSH